MKPSRRSASRTRTTSTPSPSAASPASPRSRGSRVRRRLAVLAPLALLPLGLSLVGPEPAPAAEGGRVVVLGFDGADARTVRELVATRPEDYPTFARLAEQGTFAPLEVVAPPESPVSWAALNTGQNPAKTGVPGFVRRTLKGSVPGPTLGHLGSEDAPLEDFPDAPLPAWSGSVWSAVLGGAAFLVGLFLLLLLTRRLPVALVGALIVGAAGAWGGLRLHGYLPQSFPRTTNPNQARNFWDYAGDAGVRCVVLDPAQAFDMPAPEGVEVLAGLGVPDARGGIGDWFLYTTNPDEYNRPPNGRRDDLTAGTIFAVDAIDGRIDTQIYGPRNFWLEEKLRAEIEELEKEAEGGDFDATMAANKRKSALEEDLDRARSNRTGVDLTVQIEEDAARVTICGQEQLVREGEWSDFYELTFELNPLISVQALTRVRVDHLHDPYFELFVNVLDIDPRRPPFWQAISEPAGYSAELASRCGLFETYGWSTATMPFKDGVVPPELLLEDVEFTMAWRERLTYDQLSRDDWRVLMSVFSTTDRIQHMMYRYYDEGHPMHDPEEAAHRVTFFGEDMPLSETIPMIYRQMDRIIGKVLDEYVREGDTLLVCSDHGFQSFRRQVHVNNLLAELGYLKVKPLTRKRDGEFLSFVDWEGTQAYSLGMGFVYLNLRGREKSGIVDPADAREVMEKIRSDMLEARDPDSGERVCEAVYVTEDVHEGPHIDLESDLLLGFAPTYRVSWASTFGGLAVEEDELGGWRPASICADNQSLWSGGHVSVALPAVAGVFLSNRKLDPEQSFESLRIGPTVLELVGAPVPAEMDRPPLAFAD